MSETELSNEQEPIEAGTAGEEENLDSVEKEEAGVPEAEEDLQTSLEKALVETEKFRDMALRAEAELQNVRRRAEKDVESAHKYGTEKFLLALLPVVDSLEKAIEAAEAASDGTNKEDAVIEGVQICLKMFQDVLTREKVEVLDPHGEPFDPKFHEAISLIEHEEMEPNSVVAVIQKGYKLNERLVRPAMVMVSKAAEKKETDNSK